MRPVRRNAQVASCSKAVLSCPVSPHGLRRSGGSVESGARRVAYRRAERGLPTTAIFVSQSSCRDCFPWRSLRFAAAPKHAASVPRMRNFRWLDNSSAAIMIAKRRCKMAQILVRDIEDDVKERLQRRAARHGHSMEAEIRDILRDVVKADMEPAGGLGTEIAALFRGIGLQSGEEIPELRGFSIKNVFEE